MSLKFDFIVSQLWILSWNASVQRAQLFDSKTTNHDRRKFRNAIILFLRENILPKYETKASPKNNIYKTSRNCLMKEQSSRWGYAWPEGYKIGVAQKLLNLQLKYLWCLGLISEPPHCPVDRIIINETDLKDRISWTKITDITEYMTSNLCAKTSFLAINPSLEWELEVYNRRRNSSSNLDRFEKDSPQPKENSSYPFKSHGKGTGFESI
jgi:hypothetical protein